MALVSEFIYPISTIVEGHVQCKYMYMHCNCVHEIVQCSRSTGFVGKNCDIIQKTLILQIAICIILQLFVYALIIFSGNVQIHVQTQQSASHTED